jgi:DNA modification methylase
MKCRCEHCGDQFDGEPQGGHRILVATSTDADAVARLMVGGKADLCLTDPPYGIGETASAKNDYRSYDDTPDNLVCVIRSFLPLAQSVARVVVLTPGNANIGRYPSPTWIMAWFTPAGIGSGPWGFCCWQPVLCYGKDPKLAKGKGRHPDAIVHTETAEKFGHPCTKPIKFWSWLMERASEPGDQVYDPFAGSGTTIIAAELTGRTCLAIEIDPIYVDMTVTRWENFTGRAAVHIDGHIFAEVVREAA